MRANEYALNSSAHKLASAPIQQAVRTHLDEAAELLRDLRDLHHDYPEPEVRWPLAAILRDGGHSLGENGAPGRGQEAATRGEGRRSLPCAGGFAG